MGDTATTPVVKIVRLTAANQDALVLLDEYYEELGVRQRDTGTASLQKIIDTPASGVWLAILGDRAVGCVVLRRLDSVPSASECKRLYVQLDARGNRIAEKLLDTQEAYAISQGVEWIYLDSRNDLKTAIAI